MTILARYAVEEFDASDSIANLASGIIVIGTISTRLFTGKFLDTSGYGREVYDVGPCPVAVNDPGLVLIFDSAKTR